VPGHWFSEDCVMLLSKGNAMLQCHEAGRCASRGVLGMKAVHLVGTGKAASRIRLTFCNQLQQHRELCTRFDHQLSPSQTNGIRMSELANWTKAICDALQGILGRGGISARHPTLHAPINQVNSQFRACAQSLFTVRFTAPAYENGGRVSCYDGEGGSEAEVSACEHTMAELYDSP
jgi:hypothetical protein